jgi:hypothetical protein
MEATALAVLALEGDPKAPLADLGATLLSGYSPIYGWGDGRANLVCMQAVLRLFKDPIPPNIEIVLTADGQPIAQGELSRDKVREVMTLEAADIDVSGSRTWRVEATPAVPGLGFSLALTRWEPWPQTTGSGGVALEIAPPQGARVGRAVDVELRAVAPSGSPLRIELQLPAGVQPDTAALDALVESGALTRYQNADGQIALFAPSLEPAQTFATRVRVIPTLAGSLQSGPATLTVSGTQSFVPPTRWTIAP